MDSGKHATAVAKCDFFWIKGSVMWQTAGSRCTRAEIIYKYSYTYKFVEGGGGVFKEKENYFSIKSTSSHRRHAQGIKFVQRSIWFLVFRQYLCKSASFLNRVMQLCSIKNALQIEEQLRREKQIEIYLHKL